MKLNELHVAPRRGRPTSNTPIVKRMPAAA